MMLLASGRAGAGPTGAASPPGVRAARGEARTTAGLSRPLLPADNVVPGWVHTEEPRVFDAQTLYAHIDGGAEEFLAQGFRTLSVVGYRKDSLEAVAEIYDLGTRQGATAILDARGGAPPEGRQNPGARPSAVGEACVLDTTQVLFRRGRFYVALTGFEARPEVTAALRVLADSIDARIRAATGSPAKK
jgi:hypothetical protein